jgi:hypothetical protein
MMLLFLSKFISDEMTFVFLFPSPLLKRTNIFLIKAKCIGEDCVSFFFVDKEKCGESVERKSLNTHRTCGSS